MLQFLKRIKRALGFKDKPSVKTNLEAISKLLKNPEFIATIKSEELAKAMIAPLMPNWKPAAEGTKCGMCGSEKVERSVILAGGPFSGSIRCNECYYVESVCSYIARSCIVVEPLAKEAPDKIVPGVKAE